MSWHIVKADALEFLQAQPAGSLDLVFASPPYEKARLYLEAGQDLGIARDTESWVAWMVEVVQASLQACTGLVAFVVEGQTKDYSYSCAPALLIADLARAGVCLRKPPIYHRIGIPGSGGPDWLRNDWEWIVCCTNGGPLPWSDNTAMGHLPLWGPGGEMSNRNGKDTRRNQWGKNGPHSNRKANGKRDTTERPSSTRLGRGMANGVEGSTKGSCASVPAIANPGNVITCHVGGGQMGHPLAHENEAPFPEALAEFFVLSFAPPGGLVCDPFSGSGTTAASCKNHGRNFTGCDLRQSQVDLGLRRLADTTEDLFSKDRRLPPAVDTGAAAKSCGYHTGQECGRCGSRRLRPCGPCAVCEDCGEMTGGCQ